MSLGFEVLLFVLLIHSFYVLNIKWAKEKYSIEIGRTDHHRIKGERENIVVRRRYRVKAKILNL